MNTNELGEKVGRALGRSRIIKINKPGGKKKQRDAIHAEASNTAPPWRSGRKPAKRKKK